MLIGTGDAERHTGLFSGRPPGVKGTVVTSMRLLAVADSKHHVNAVSSAGTRDRTLLVSDLDGTLLRPDATLGPRTLEIVNDFTGGGGLFTYATARSFTSASRATHGLQLTLPVVTYGGAIIVDPSLDTDMAPKLLRPSAAAQVLEITATSSHVQPLLFVIHDGRDRVCWLAGRTNPSIDRFVSERHGDPRLMPLRHWSQIDTSAVFYISLISDRASLLDVRSELSPLGCHVTLSEDVYTPDVWWLDLTSSTATKATALISLMQQIGADTLISFGDNRNDLPMFAISDHTVAVANAIPEVRAEADEVIGTNDSESVAGWIAEHG